MAQSGGLRAWSRALNDKSFTSDKKHSNGGVERSGDEAKSKNKGR